MDAKTLAAELSPALQEILNSHKDDFIAEAGGWLTRKALEIAWPVIMRLLPRILQAGIELLAWKFGTMTLIKVMDLLMAIRNASPSTGTAFTRSVDNHTNNRNIWM